LVVGVLWGLVGSTAEPESSARLVALERGAAVVRRGFGDASGSEVAARGDGDAGPADGLGRAGRLGGAV
jgi:hypothetical protein